MRRRSGMSTRRTCRLCCFAASHSENEARLGPRFHFGTVPGRAIRVCGDPGNHTSWATRQQGFQGTVDLNGIAATVDAVQKIPIIGNGDVRSVADALHMRLKTGCAAVAIGRGAMLDPWIFRKLADIELGRPPQEPDREEQIDFLIRHFTLMTEQHQDRSCLLFRKFAAWYGCALVFPRISRTVCDCSRMSRNSNRS